MTQNSNKALIRRWIAFANTGFARKLGEFIAPDYIGQLGGCTMDRLELERLEREFRRAFPDTRHSIDDLIKEDDKVVLRSTARATHHGEFHGTAPTGRKVECTAIVIYRVQYHSRIMGRNRLPQVVETTATRSVESYVKELTSDDSSDFMCRRVICGRLRALRSADGHGCCRRRPCGLLSMSLPTPSPSYAPSS